MHCHPLVQQRVVLSVQRAFMHAIQACDQRASKLQHAVPSCCVRPLLQDCHLIHVRVNAGLFSTWVCSDTA